MDLIGRSQSISNIQIDTISIGIYVTCEYKTTMTGKNLEI